MIRRHLKDIDNLRAKRLLQLQILLVIIDDLKIARETPDDGIAVILADARREPLGGVLDELRLDGVVVARVGEHVLLELDGRLPQADLEEHDAQSVDVVDLAEGLLRLALPFGVAVDVLCRDEVGRPRGEEGFWAAEVEAEDPGGGE